MSSSYQTGNDRGAGLTEYAVLLLLIAVACIAIVTNLGIAIFNLFTQALDAF